MARKHWMSEIADEVRQSIKDAIPAVASGIKGEVPFAYQPPKRHDEVKAFLNMDNEQRQQFFHSMSPDQYRDWSEGMMKKLTTRFGPAAQVLMPMLQGAPIEDVALGVSSDDGTLGIAAAEADLTQILGFDPFE